MSTRVDTVALIIANCRFVSPPDASFDIVTIREPLGLWRGAVTRAVNGYRHLFLWASGLTPETAVCELHAKSADVARSYIDTNGYTAPKVPNVTSAPASVPRTTQMAPGSADGAQKSDLSDSSLTAECVDLSLSSDCESLSDGETLSVVSEKARSSKRSSKNKKSRKGHEHKDSRKGANERQSRSRSRSRSRSTARSVSQSSGSMSRSPSRSRSRSRVSSLASGLDIPPQNWGRSQAQPQAMSNTTRPFANSLPPLPAPPPGFAAWPAQPPVMPSMSSMVPRMNGGVNIHPHPNMNPNYQNRPPAQPTAPKGPPPGGPSLPWLTASSSDAAHDLIIHIHWIGHGYGQVLKRLVPTRSALKNAAVSHVCRNASLFRTGGGGSVVQGQLVATLRSVSVGGEQIELSNYQGDSGLGTLLRDAAGAASAAAASRSGGAGGGYAAPLPRFEVDVQSLPAAVP